MECLHVVASELDLSMSLEGISEGKDLADVETTALRGAIMLLETACFARRAIAKAKADRKQKRVEATERAKLAEKRAKLAEKQEKLFG